MPNRSGDRSRPASRVLVAGLASLGLLLLAHCSEQPPGGGGAGVAGSAGTSLQGGAAGSVPPRGGDAGTGQPTTGGTGGAGGAATGGSGGVGGVAGATGATGGTSGESPGGRAGGGNAGTPATGGSAGNAGIAGTGGITAGSAGTGGSAGDDSREIHFRDWPDGAEPATVGARVRDVFAAQNLAGDKHYKIACAWYGSLAMSAVLMDRAGLDALIAKYEPYRGTYGELLSGAGYVDDNVFGIVPLEIALHSSDAGYRQEGLAIADHQRANIEVQTRFAIDDMFMITALQVQAYRASKAAGDESGGMKYLNTAASVMVEYLDRLQQQDGLFFHHEDFEHRWARGNGWFAAGMAELIRELPQSHADYPAIREGYERMMDGLLAYQIENGAGAGLWNQVVDSDDARNWPETSGSAMFAYALVSGVRAGWLEPAKYGPPARAAWLSLVGKLNARGELQDISDWAYKPESHPDSGTKYVNDEENYYFDRPKLTGDNHGQAPMLWTAAALAR